MGLKSFAENGCGLTDSLATLYKLKLAKDELEQGKALQEAQIKYYNSHASLLDRTDPNWHGKGGRGGGGGGGSSATVDTAKLFNPDGSVNTKALTKAVPAATKNALLGVQAQGQDAPFLNTALSGLKGISEAVNAPAPSLHFNTPQDIYTGNAAAKVNAPVVKQAGIDQAILLKALLSGADPTQAAQAVSTATAAAPVATPPPMYTGSPFLPQASSPPPRLPGETLEQYKARTGL